MKTRALIAVLALLTAGAALAQQQAQQPLRKTLRTQRTFTLAPGGSFVLDNPFGDVEVVGSDTADVEATIVTVLTARDAAALDEAVRQSGLLIGQDPKTRIIRTAAASYTQRKPWSAVAHWNVRVPRNANVQIVSSVSDRIRVSNINGVVRVKNFNGNVALTNVPAGGVVESVNGSIVYNTEQPRGNVVLSTLNGHITANVSADADFRWVAETATGDIRTNLPARGAFFGAVFRGSVNAPGGPTITTTSLMGNVHMLGTGIAAATQSQSIRRTSSAPPPPASAGPRPQQASMTATPAVTRPRVLQRDVINGTFSYSTNLGDVKIGEIRGNATIATGAGEVQLGSVAGTCEVRSNGGPLHLGEILGTLNASTRVGDIFIDSTRRGGTIATQGGTIRLLYTSGPTRLTSGGGDITIRQAAAPVNAETSSGDITISVDPLRATAAMQAKTGKGNVVLNVDSKFAADVDATIITSDPNADTFLSDVPGLSVSRSQSGGKTVVRATGKLNGGGDRVVLHANDGDIRITTGRLGPTIVRR